MHFFHFYPSSFILLPYFYDYLLCFENDILSSIGTLIFYFSSSVAYSQNNNEIFQKFYLRTEEVFQHPKSFDMF